MRKAVRRSYGALLLALAIITYFPDLMMIDHGCEGAPTAPPLWLRVEADLV